MEQNCERAACHLLFVFFIRLKILHRHWKLLCLLLLCVQQDSIVR
jgi:hypothetical protein